MFKFLAFKNRASFLSASESIKIQWFSIAAIGTIGPFLICLCRHLVEPTKSGYETHPSTCTLCKCILVWDTLESMEGNPKEMKDTSKSMVDTSNNYGDNLEEMGGKTKSMRAYPESLELTSKSLAESYFVWRLIWRVCRTVWTKWWTLVCKCSLYRKVLPLFVNQRRY